MSEFYNETIKNMFFEENAFAEGRKKTLTIIFKKTKIHEQALMLDIYEMNKEECESLLYYFKARSTQHIRTYISHLRRYVDWCISQGLVPHRINYFNTLGNKGIVEKFINSQITGKQIITKELLEKYINKLNTVGDYQSSIIINLLFIGVKLSSDDNKCELRNIKVSDIDFDNNIIKTIKREIIINENTKQLINNALEQTARINLITMRERESSYREIEYNNLDYLIRSRNISKNLYAPSKYQVVRTKIQEISIYVNNPSINATYLNLSGIIDYIKENYTEEYYDRPRGAKDAYIMYEDIIEKFKLTTTREPLKNRLIQFLK